MTQKIKGYSPALKGRRVKAKSRGRPKKRSKLIRAKWPRVHRVLNHNRELFMVDARRARFSESRRSFYQTEDKALAAAEQLERDWNNEGASAFADLSATERKDAARALKILAQHDGADLVDAATHYVAHLKAQQAAARAKTVGECIDAYLGDKRADFEKERISKFTLYEIESKMRLVRHALGEDKITQIDEAAAEAFLKNLPAKFKPRYRANIRTKLSQLLNFCVRQKWTAHNPVTEITKVKVPQGEVEILTVQQAKALLRSAEASEHATDVLPYVAVSLFGGLRPGEAAQLRWELVHFNTKQIEVRAETSKTRETRFVHLEPTLAQWLLPYRKRSGPIVGTNFAKDLKAIKATAGFGTGKKAVYRWHKDVLRHCFGSYWLPIHGDRARLAEEMGNSIAVIKSHYKRAIPKHVAEPYWKIRPKAKAPKKPAQPATESGKVIEFPTQSAEILAKNGLVNC